jgi:hypothetical protein
MRHHVTVTFDVDYDTAAHAEVMVRALMDGFHGVWDRLEGYSVDRVTSDDKTDEAEAEDMLVEAHRDPLFDDDDDRLVTEDGPPPDPDD